MANSKLYQAMSSGFKRLEKTFLNFKARPGGDYTRRQLSMAAAYTVFCHAEIETYVEGWATAFTDFAENKWKSGQATRPLVHLCTFHEGRNALSNVPSKDVWNEVVHKAIAKHRGIISSNHGIKEANVCELLSPIGFNTTSVDSVLLADLSAFGTLRGDYAHKSLKVQVGTIFDPFDRRNKVKALELLLATLDAQLALYLASA